MQGAAQQSPYRINGIAGGGKEAMQNKGSAKGLRKQRKLEQAGKKIVWHAPGNVQNQQQLPLTSWLQVQQQQQQR